MTPILTNASPEVPKHQVACWRSRGEETSLSHPKQAWLAQHFCLCADPASQSQRLCLTGQHACPLARPLTRCRHSAICWVCFIPVQLIEKNKNWILSPKPPLWDAVCNLKRTPFISPSSATVEIVQEVMGSQTRQSPKSFPALTSRGLVLLVDRHKLEHCKCGTQPGLTNSTALPVSRAPRSPRLGLPLLPACGLRELWAVAGQAVILYPSGSFL